MSVWRSAYTELGHSVLGIVLTGLGFGIVFPGPVVGIVLPSLGLGSNRHVIALPVFDLRIDHLGIARRQTVEEPKDICI